MPFQRTAVGLDIGARNVKAVRLRLAGPEARAERALVLPRAGLEGRDEDDVAEAASPGALAIEEPERFAGRLREALDRERIDPRGVVLGLDARDAMLRYTNAPPMPRPRLETVMRYEIESVADRMEEAIASDWCLLPGRRDDGERTVMFGIAKEEPLRSLLDALEGAGITVRHAVPGALALWAAWDLFGTKAPPDAPGDDLVLALDLGHAGLHMALVLNDRLVFARSASFGGRQFTEGLAGALHLAPAEAERLKVERGGLDEAPGVGPDTVGPLRGVAGQLLNNLQSSIRFATSQGGVTLPSVSRIWATGGGLRLRGLAPFLGRSFGGKPVEIFDPAAGGNGPAGDERPPAALALALGLGASGLGAGRGSAVSLDVLPASYKRRREFRERTLWLWAAAAMLVLFLGARLVQAVALGSHASGLEEALETRLDTLETKAAERDQDRRQAAEVRARLRRLLEEAQPTALQAFLLDWLADSLPASVQLDGLALSSEERPDAAGFEHEVLLRGRASDEERRGLDLVLELQESLRREERVGDVRVLSTEREGPWTTFRLAVVPASPEV